MWTASYQDTYAGPPNLLLRPRTFSYGRTGNWIGKASIATTPPWEPRPNLGYPNRLLNRCTYI